MLTFGMRFCEEVFEVFNKLVVGNSAASFHIKSRTESRVNSVGAAIFPCVSSSYQLSSSFSSADMYIEGARRCTISIRTLAFYFLTG